MTDYKKLKVAELKDLLTSRALSTAGKKDELVARLEEADVAEAPAEPAAQADPAAPAAVEAAAEEADAADTPGVPPLARCA